MIKGCMLNEGPKKAPHLVSRIGFSLPSKHGTQGEKKYHAAAGERADKRKSCHKESD